MGFLLRGEFGHIQASVTGIAAEVCHLVLLSLLTLWALALLTLWALALLSLRTLTLLSLRTLALLSSLCAGLSLRTLTLLLSLCLRTARSASSYIKLCELDEKAQLLKAGE